MKLNSQFWIYVPLFFHTELFQSVYCVHSSLVTLVTEFLGSVYDLADCWFFMLLSDSSLEKNLRTMLNSVRCELIYFHNHGEIQNICLLSIRGGTDEIYDIMVPWDQETVRDSCC